MEVMREIEFISILNDVLGPVMRGPSSSHTAGSYRIGLVARALLGDEPRRATFTFDPDGSYARTFRQQAVDLALAAGIMGWPITDSRFPRALEIAKKAGLDLDFRTARLPKADHPNTVLIVATARDGGRLEAVAKSTGGGGIAFTEIDGRPATLDGKSYETIISSTRSAGRGIDALMARAGRDIGPVFRWAGKGEVRGVWRKGSPLEPRIRAAVESTPGFLGLRSAPPVFFVRKGMPIFAGAAEMIRIAGKRSRSLGQIALAYESCLLGQSEESVLAEILLRYAVMKASVERGLRGRDLSMNLLQPSAGRIFRAEKSRKTALGGIQTRAAARAMAVMHVANSRGIVCAAPTGGSAGVIPGVVVTLAEERKAGDREIALMLLAASAVGLIIAKRATFAAEVAGCQVEIGAAGAMAAAAVVEFAGGSARQAADAAAISLQNTMGSACDLVQGMCEIPCHTRNAAAAAGAFVSADLILGGYGNPISLDETIDASFASGRMLPAELRCTARGGIALAPSALALTGARRPRR
jgi:L-serine dehydratase